MFPRLAPTVIGAALASLASIPAAIAIDRSQDDLKDLFFGAAMYEAYQGEHFDAIVSLDTELAQYRRLDQPELDPFTAHYGEAEFSVGDLELSYRMHREAGRAIEAVLKGDVPRPVRNEAAYRLARIHYHKQQPRNALHALEMIEGRVPERVRAREQFLRARVYMELGRFSEAVELLEDLQGEEELDGFVEYNLGIALLKAGEQAEGIAELTALGKRSSSDSAKQALYDKTNLMLGSRLMEAGELELARPYFDRVHLEGPFSNRALLGAGWVEARAGRFDRALVPWKMLQKRKHTNEAVQEALLAVPYAYGKLNVHSTAAVNYGHALDVFGEEVDTLTASIESIREGKFLEALRRKEADQVKNWVVTLRSIPGAPETHYLLDLMASNDYQEFLRNYRDLNDLHERNAEWLKSLRAFESIIAERRAYYEPLLPGLDEKFRALDARIKLRTEQRDTFAQRIDQMLVTRRPEHLAKTQERESLLRVQRIRALLDRQPSLVSEETKARVQRLEGILHWRLATEYDARLTEAYKHLQELNTEIGELQQVYNSYVRSRQAATHSYVGYDDTIRSLRARIEQVQPRIERLMARQGAMLEQMAINELEGRRARLESYQIKARFALADSYDRAHELQEQRADQRRIEEYQSRQAEQPATQDKPEPSADGEPLPQDTPPELEPDAAGEEAAQ
ncbi:tetratricopeptide repeat protein [Microbulbifer yueqingensis]|uniref:Tetratricopeptide repeat-containing protein n=1 Tax=Microbulbifer yueqingensis TaxID=658219 RepID=A0A1G8XKF3_9GAMM|nr:tetratricopeptide repeat protein [Microbulbifer yueqingensis]SDJ91132.1 Tetratricopeptide repeat-containing protein [Microbulbifer yueqingensis]